MAKIDLANIDSGISTDIQKLLLRAFNDGIDNDIPLCYGNKIKLETAVEGVYVEVYVDSSDRVVIPNARVEGIRIDKTGVVGRATLHIHSHQMTHVADEEQVVCDFKGEFLSESGIMDGIRCQYTLDISSTGILRTIVANAYLGSEATLSGSGALYGILAGVNAVGIVDGAGVELAAIHAGIIDMIGGTLTQLKHLSAISLNNRCMVAPSAGELQLLLMTNDSNAAIVDQAIYLDGGDRMTEFLHIVNASGMVDVRGTPSKTAAGCDGWMLCTLEGKQVKIALYNAVTIDD